MTYQKDVYCTYSNSFALPLPGLVTLLGVASLTMVEGTLAALTPLARRRAAAPVVNFTINQYKFGNQISIKLGQFQIPTRTWWNLWTHII